MKIVALLAAILFASQATETPPKYRGLDCIGWVKPTAQAMADGTMEGDNVVVNTPLTDDEKIRLFKARSVADAAYKAEREITDAVVAAHGFKLGEFDRAACGEMVMIRAGEYHITHFVPSNPKYPAGDEKCRDYFAALRKNAVPAIYGNGNESPF